MQRHGTLVLVAVLTLALASGWALGQSRYSRQDRGGPGGPGMGRAPSNLSREQIEKIAEIRRSTMEAIQKVISQGKPKPQQGACPHCGAVRGKAPQVRFSKPAPSRGGHGRPSGRYERPSPGGHGEPKAHGAPKGRHDAHGTQAKRSRESIGDRIRQFLAQRAQMTRSRSSFGRGTSSSRYSRYGGHDPRGTQAVRSRGSIGDRIRQYFAQRAQMSRSRSSFGPGRSSSRSSRYGGFGRGGFQGRPQPTPFRGRPSSRGGFGRGPMGGRPTPVPHGRH